MQPRSPSLSALILAGGQARRMQGVDKGLVTLKGTALIDHVIARLRPQVQAIRINANRSLEEYASRDLAVVSDHLSGYQGPLAGMATGLDSSPSEWLLVVPCDTPFLPTDLAGRLLQAATEDGSEIAVAHDGERLQPVICLLHRALQESLERFLADGGRKIDRWFAEHRVSRVDFSDQPDAFININTLQEKQLLESGAA
ncbi:molybdenum cofactor guanylyltransferase MobA [Motiliproteus sp. SC1-56]|uniref:molybdenum cofactor guanylyltransferase MobA n=1 Tax=Motiliproteus sp. SC1-56 TaxID=2799565 RepID=UPI001A8EA176|nr:molybdenum cofactor guanylyltransferase MobA [Motiliproteus sp. SC1-56]